MLTFASKAELNARLKEEYDQHPELADVDDQASSSLADGQSTAPISSAGTPLASTSTVARTTLKLTFNKAQVSNGDAGSPQSEDADEDME